MGSLYKGTIVATRTAQLLYDVAIEGFGTVSGCYWAAGWFSGLGGIRTTFIPPPGTRVVVLYGSPSMVVSMIPSDTPDMLSSDNRTMTGELEDTRDSFDGYSNTGSSEIGRTHTPFSDMIEGELDISNLMGVGIALLTNFARLSGGGRAIVECHVLNDMVRIVSDTFKHYNAFGEFKIYNDGRLNMRTDGTSYDFEAMGQLDPKDNKYELNDALPDIANIDSLNRTGRYRFSQFVGFLGDFVHTFVTDPTAVLGELSADAIRSGKANVHINGDGTVLVQSVAEIAFERVTRIVVPIETKRHEENLEVRAKQMDKLNKSYLKLWNYGKDMKNAWQVGYQLREYSRWLSQYYSLARFKQLEDSDGAWKVPTEAETPEPKWHGEEKDKKEANNGSDDSYIIYATIRIMRDGGIMSLAGDGSCVHQGNGTVTISSPRHVRIEAAGDVSIVAGQSIFLKARRSIEIFAVVGGLMLKARTWLQQLCEKGSIWIKSDAEEGGSEEGDPETVVHKHGVIIESSQHGVLIHADQELAIESLKKKIIIQTKDDLGDIDIVSGGNIGIKAGSSANKTLLLYAKELGARADKIMMDPLKFMSISQYATFWAGSAGGASNTIQALHIKRIVAEQVSSRTIKGKKLHNRPDPQAASAKKCPTHINHINLGTEADLKLKNHNVEDTDKLRLVAEIPVVLPKMTEGSPVMRMRDNTLYGEDRRFRNDDHLVQTLAQQHLVDDAETQDEYDTWDWKDDVLLTAPRIAPKSFPFPGRTPAKMYAHEDSLQPSLTELSSVEPSPIGKALTLVDITFKYLRKDD